MGRASGSRFEYELMRAINDAFMRERIRGVAYRRYSPPKVVQLFDILVDCGGLRKYAAVECKSVMVNGKIVYYFSKASESKGMHQFRRELEWAEKAGRRAILALELKEPEKRERSCYMLSMRYLLERMEDGATGITREDLLNGKEILRAEGGWYIGAGSLAWLLGA